MEKLLSEDRELEENEGIEFRKIRQRQVRNKMVDWFQQNGTNEFHSDEWVVAYHPKVRTKHFPYGIIQVMSIDGYNRMKKWKEKII